MGAAVVDNTGRVIWAEALAPGTSAQKAELIAVIQALERARGRRVTIYTDSRYAFSTVHLQGPIYKERGLLMAEGREIKNLPEIRRLLAAVHCPRRYPQYMSQDTRKERMPGPKGTVLPMQQPVRQLLDIRGPLY